MDRTLTELEADYIALRKEELIQELRPFLGLDETHAPQGEVAKRLGTIRKAPRVDKNLLITSFFTISWTLAPGA